MSRLNDLIRQVARTDEALADRPAAGGRRARRPPVVRPELRAPRPRGRRASGAARPPRRQGPHPAAARGDARRRPTSGSGVSSGLRQATGRPRARGARRRRAQTTTTRVARRPGRGRRVPRPDLPGTRLDRQGRARRRQAVPHRDQRRELPRAPGAAVHASRQGRRDLYRPAVQHRGARLEVQQRLRRRRRPLPALASGWRSWSAGCCSRRSC